MPFTAHTRMSGIDLDGREIRKGAADAIPAWSTSNGARRRRSCGRRSSGSRASGGTPLVVAESGRALGVIHLKDIVKGGMRERFAHCARWASRRS